MSLLALQFIFLAVLDCLLQVHSERAWSFEFLTWRFSQDLLSGFYCQPSRQKRFAAKLINKSCGKKLRRLLRVSHLSNVVGVWLDCWGFVIHLWVQQSAILAGEHGCSLLCERLWHLLGPNVLGYVPFLPISLHLLQELHLTLCWWKPQNLVLDALQLLEHRVALGVVFGLFPAFHLDLVLKPCVRCQVEVHLWGGAQGLMFKSLIGQFRSRPVESGTFNLSSLAPLTYGG